MSINLVNLTQNRFNIFIITTTLIMVACGTAQPPADVEILNRLPTLTPTPSTSMGSDDSAAPPASSPDQPIESDGANAPTGTEDAANLTTEPVAQPTPADVSPFPDDLSDAPVIIVGLDRIEEYVEIANISSEPQDLTGWNILSETGSQRCNLAGVLDPGETLRIWARAAQASNGGYNCGFSQEIWDDAAADPAVLFNSQKVEISRFE